MFGGGYHPSDGDRCNHCCCPHQGCHCEGVVCWGSVQWVWLPIGKSTKSSMGVGTEGTVRGTGAGWEGKGSEE